MKEALLSSEQDVEDRAKDRPLRDAQLNPNPRSSSVTHDNHLRAISQVGFDPVQRCAVNAEGQMKTLQKELMINHVKGCGDIEECKKGQVRSVNSCILYIREQSKEESFGGMVTSETRLSGR